MFPERDISCNKCVFIIITISTIKVNVTFSPRRIHDNALQRFMRITWAYCEVYYEKFSQLLETLWTDAAVYRNNTCTTTALHFSQWTTSFQKVVGAAYKLVSYWLTASPATQNRQVLWQMLPDRENFAPIGFPVKFLKTYRCFL